MHFRAQVIYSFRQEKRRRTLARAGGALAAFVHANRFGVVAPEGLAWGGGIVIDAGPDEFSPRAAEVDVWAVEWVHRADIGDRFLLEEGEAVWEQAEACGPITVRRVQAGQEHLANTA